MRRAPTLTPSPAVAAVAALTAALLMVGSAALLGGPAAAATGTAPTGTAPTGGSASVSTASTRGVPTVASPRPGGALLFEPGVHVRAKPGAHPTPLPNIVATSFVVSDATTGEVLAAKNAHTPMRPASTLKTLTAVTLLPRLNPNAYYTPVYSDVDADGSKVGIVAGSRYTIEQLWYGLFLASGNDTAHALALANGGMARTVAEMNAEAHRLQADDTVAKTPSGLDAPGQHSSAYDLALISRAGLQMPAFAKYCGTLDVKFPRAGTTLPRKTFMTYNHNPLLLDDYPGAIGVKTGYTIAAGHTFVGAARRGNQTILVTLMNYTGATYTTAASLLNWGFANESKVEPVGQLVNPLPTASSHPTGRTQVAGAALAPTSSSHGHGLWLILVLVAIAAALGAFLIRGGLRMPASDPLAAANRGRGRSRRADRPRGPTGPGRF